MSKPDTSSETVEQMALDYEDALACQPHDVCKVQRADCCPCAQTAATLRALLAERDEARAEVEQYRVDLTEALLERDEARAMLAAQAPRDWSAMGGAKPHTLEQRVAALEERMRNR